MMVKTEISVVVPVYNSEKYLSECIESILNQTYGEIELILVDDGSTDGSGRICDEYAARDSRVRVIHKENGGPGSARNMGIDAARGEYLTFVDSDDTVKSCAYEEMLSFIAEHDADIVCSSLEKREDDELKILNRIDALKARLITHEISDSSCDKLYKRDIFGDDLRYPCDRLLSEDSAIIYRLIERAEKVVLTSRLYYKIRTVENSLSRRRYNSGFKNTIVTYEEMVEFFNVKQMTEFENIAKGYALGALFFNAGELHLSGQRDVETKKFIKKHAKRQKKQYGIASFKDRILVNLIILAFPLFGLLYKIKSRGKNK